MGRRAKRNLEGRLGYFPGINLRPCPSNYLKKMLIVIPNYRLILLAGIRWHRNIKRRTKKKFIAA